MCLDSEKADGRPRNRCEIDGTGCRLRTMWADWRDLPSPLDRDEMDQDPWQDPFAPLVGRGHVTWRTEFSWLEVYIQTYLPT